MRIKSNVSANAVKCDVPGCTTTPFYSYSTIGKVRAQAKSAGWRRASRFRVSVALGVSQSDMTGGKTSDVCPSHIPPKKERKAPPAP